MTAFTREQIPAEIQTIEQLTVWCGSILQRLNKQRTILEAEGEIPSLAVQFFQLAAADFTERAIYRVSVPLDANWQSNRDGAFWESVQQLSTADLPLDLIAQPNA